MFFALWLGDLLALLFLLVLIFLWIKKPNVLLHDFLVIAGLIGIGSVFGLRFEPLTMVLFLLLFSVYDFIAVYKTGHMVKMAKSMTESGAIIGIILPFQEL